MANEEKLKSLEEVLSFLMKEANEYNTEYTNDKLDEVKKYVEHRLHCLKSSEMSTNITSKKNK